MLSGCVREEVARGRFVDVNCVGMQCSLQRLRLWWPVQRARVTTPALGPECCNSQSTGLRHRVMAQLASNAYRTILDRWSVFVVDGEGDW